MSNNHQDKCKVIIVEERINPSTDYFVLPAFSNEDYEVSRYDFNSLVEPTALQGAVVVFVRYIPKAWKTLISKHGSQLQALYYFMDDDLFDLSASAGLSWRYRWKLFSKAYIHQYWLRQQQAKILLSTPYLEHKYQHSWQAKLIEPKPLKAQLLHISELQNQASIQPDTSFSDNNEIVLFYHGSASHQAEIDWLFPIIKTLLDEFSNVRFELIATPQVAKAFLSLARVDLVSPMHWQAYQTFITNSPRHIGLAPVLNTPFNKARSYTKFFDITTSGAVAVLAKDSIFEQFLHNKSNDQKALACLVPMQSQAWINEIRQLILDTERRASLASNARQFLLNHYRHHLKQQTD